MPFPIPSLPAIPVGPTLAGPGAPTVPGALPPGAPGGVSVAGQSAPDAAGLLAEIFVEEPDVEAELLAENGQSQDGGGSSVEVIEVASLNPQLLSTSEGVITVDQPLLFDLFSGTVVVFEGGRGEAQEEDLGR
ncbi:hypothetical protein [Candidatus Reidiella endopervernicosa]|uniref:Uncharacterized protein n=2 Tax=Gammaproteobacteria incertae sedis TaxID=118884 RepID=A0A6N0HT37_9GAMM|nr:hypothetical protein [Candidatus Reidiella endopervernicosa]QKQ25381.1 hypothetical protein HUE57_03060 [Candidatus Reidiella endopervernicosa]